MVEQGVLTWFEQLLGRVPELIFPNRTNGRDSVWTELFTEMEVALEGVFPQSHAVLRRWKEARVLEAEGVKKDFTPDLEKPQNDLIAIFRTAHRLLH